MTQPPPIQSESRWSKRLTVIIIGSMLITFLLGVFTVVWIGLHVLDARHEVPASRTVVPLPKPTALLKHQSPTLTKLKDTAREYEWDLHSTKPFNEVRVPFEYSGGGITTPSKKWLIFVKATLAGKTSPCIVDTGASDVSWPQWFNLQGQHYVGKLSEGINNSHRPTDVVKLSRLAIGDYQLHPVYTNMIQRTTQEAGVADVVPIIGNYAFDSIVLTIDYQNKVLILRDPEYDVTRHVHSSKDIKLDFEWIADSPCVQGSIEGHKAKFLVDTGCDEAVSITKRFYNTHIRAHQTTQHTYTGAFGKVQGLQIRKIDCNIGEQKVHQEEVSVDDDPGGYDGTIGKPFLAQYDVTIDYPRRKILLHRNGLQNTTGNGL